MSNSLNEISPARRIIATLAAGGVGVCVVVAHAATAGGLLLLAAQSPRDIGLIFFAMLQATLALAAVPATIDIARLQRVWVELGLQVRLLRLSIYAMAWLAPLMVGVTLPLQLENIAAGAATSQLLTLLITTTLIELHRVGRLDAHLPSPGRCLLRLLTAWQSQMGRE